MGYSRLLWPLLVVNSLIPSSIADYVEVSNDQCDCYLTNGSHSNYFTTHQFFDFREKLEHVNVPNLIEDADESSQAVATSSYFLTSEWTDNWAIQSWNNTGALNSSTSDATVFMVHSPNNVYIEENKDEDAGSSTFLTLRTARLKDFQSTCEFESKAHNFHFVSARMYARTIGAPGAVTAMFTYKEMDPNADLTAVQESDLEIRTIDPHNRIQYTNQPHSTPSGLDAEGATRNVTIPDKRDWTNWAVYRMDWNPGSTTWYIDGDEVASISFQAPRDPSILIFNAWSDGGSWSGNMSVGGEVSFQIQWIELVYNTTEPAAPSKRDMSHTPRDPFEKAKRDDQVCSTICSVDQTQTIGTPVLVESSASSILGSIGFVGIAPWISVLCMVLAIW